LCSHSADREPVWVEIGQSVYFSRNNNLVNSKQTEHDKTTAIWFSRKDYTECFSYALYQTEADQDRVTSFMCDNATSHYDFYNGFGKLKLIESDLVSLPNPHDQICIVRCESKNSDCNGVYVFKEDNKKYTYISDNTNLGKIKYVSIGSMTNTSTNGLIGNVFGYARWDRALRLSEIKSLPKRLGTPKPSRK